MTIGRRHAFALVVTLALAMPMLPRPGSSNDDLEQGLKVAYLYRFTHFIEWPEAGLEGAFVIAVMGDPRFAAALRTLEVQRKEAQGRSIRVRVVDRPDAIGDCQILFVGAEAVSDLPRIRTQTDGRPILLVGDSRGLAERGVAINFFLKPDILGEGQRLRFEINPRTLSGRGLKVSAQLYDVARIVR